MSARFSGIFFDKRDHDLLAIVNDVLEKGALGTVPGGVFYDHFHPQGISEMAESRGLRIAYAVVHLLYSLEEGGLDERLRALRYLRVAVSSMSAGPLSNNTARVLLQITKELVRAKGDYPKQLELARDFRVTALGKPRMVRRQLRKYHLLEMPEEWNQVAFDDHVHDASTKGRKSPTHLIMDAWIKGIRRLRVIYYNHITPRVAAELLKAADIMGMDVRIGLEFSASFRGSYVQLIWRTKGFEDSQEFLCFLEDPVIADFMAKGREVSEFQQRYVLEALDQYNEKHRHTICMTYGLDLPVVDRSEFLNFVGAAQASLLHLGRYIHMSLLPAMEARTLELREEYALANENKKIKISALVDKMNCLDMETIVRRYLKPHANPCIINPDVPCNIDDLPELLRLSPCDLARRLNSLNFDHRITLNLTNLTPEDVLEILYCCEGAITRLELFNLKDYAEGKTGYIPGINELQRALNEDNVIKLKTVILKIIERVKAVEYPDKADRLKNLTAILHDIDSFRIFYANRLLKSRIGSDSTGLSPRVHGMGLVIRQTLSPRALKEIQKPGDQTRITIPVTIDAWPRATFIPRIGTGHAFYRFFRRIPGLRYVGMDRICDWVVKEDSTRMEKPGNIVTLGGLPKDTGNGLALDPQPDHGRKKGTPLRYLNTQLKNTLKVIVGFIPAFLTFYLTKDWWVLAWCGAFIWFGITGLRNILQSVLGGGGIRRSPLLKWGDLVSWDRITDSLLFTGFSVPLLDYAIKTLVMDQGFGINISTNPLALYAAMGLANGIYISGHNILRGLPQTAATGNFFRSILSIPIALAFNAIAGGVLGAFGVTGIDQILQKWAAIISKAASDTVAGVIEGTADRLVNMRVRVLTCMEKLRRFFDICTQLQLLYPDTPVVDILKNPVSFAKKPNPEAGDMEKLLIIHSLDMLYFWMYQPRGRSALKALSSMLSPEERDIMLNSQFVLKKQKLISQMFIDGLVGKNFAKPLAFYLDRSPGYLGAIKKMEEDQAA